MGGTANARDAARRDRPRPLGLAARRREHACPAGLDRGGATESPVEVPQVSGLRADEAAREDDARRRLSDLRRMLISGRAPGGAAATPCAGDEPLITIRWTSSSRDDVG